MNCIQEAKNIHFGSK